MTLMEQEELGEPAVCAVVVTFHPDAEVLRNLVLLRREIRSIAVVDNGSDAEDVLALRETCEQLGATLIENSGNLGIARALNQGVQVARASHADWVFLFDQDSTVSEGYAATMLACAESSVWGSRLAILVPQYLDSRFGSVLQPPARRGGELHAATTSGSLTPTSVFDQFGVFAEELFIDGVDYEFSLRVRRAGLVIAECPKAVLLHSPGTPTSHRLFGSKTFQAANYSPVRRYYQERNKIWVTRRYWRQFFPFCLGQFAISLKDFLKIVLVESNRREKIRWFLRGVRDGLRGRTGPVRG